jgi:hypothetical protein
MIRPKESNDPDFKGPAVAGIQQGVRVWSEINPMGTEGNNNPMTNQFSKNHIKIPLVLIATVILLSTGCLHSRTLRSLSCQNQSQNLRGYSSTVEFQELARVSPSIPHTIPAPGINEPVELLPLASNLTNSPELSDSFRYLTIEECQRLASTTASTATALESHRDWLANLRRTPPAILNALSEQALFERSQHSFNAVQAYLNLVRIYSKVPLLNQIDNLLDEGKEAIEQFQNAGVEIPADLSELDQKRLELCEQRAELRFNQNRLINGLETLLNLNPSELPIWTDHQFLDPSNIDPPADSAAIQRAYLQRGDLKALTILAENANCLSLEALQGGPIANQLLGVGFALPGPARWWQCLLSREINTLKQKAQRERQRQLLLLVEKKQQEIDFEIRGILHEMARDQEILAIRHRKLQTLRRSLESAELAKELQPVNPQKYLQERATELQFISDYLDLLIKLETTSFRLKQAMGEL